MNPSPLSQEAVDYALRRLWDWSSVHRNSSSDERLQAASTLLVALGLNDDLKEHINDWLDESGIVMPDWKSRGGFWLGVIVGLHMKDYE